VTRSVRRFSSRWQDWIGGQFLHDINKSTPRAEVDDHENTIAASSSALGGHRGNAIDLEPVDYRRAQISLPRAGTSATTRSDARTILGSLRPSSSSSRPSPVRSDSS